MTLVVFNLRRAVKENEVRRLFEKFGWVEEIRILPDLKSRLNDNSFAFVEMTFSSDAQDALRALDGSLFRDRILSVQEARGRPRR